MPRINVPFYNKVQIAWVAEAVARGIDDLMSGAWDSPAAPAALQHLEDALERLETVEQGGKA